MTTTKFPMFGVRLRLYCQRNRNFTLSRLLPDLVRFYKLPSYDKNRHVVVREALLVLPLSSSQITGYIRACLTATSSLATLKHCGERQDEEVIEFVSD